jgi:hypothetical protein
VSGNAEIRSGESNWRPPLEWLQILFGEKPLPPRCGLYFHSQVSDKPYIERGFKFMLRSENLEDTVTGRRRAVAAIIIEPFFCRGLGFLRVFDSVW